MAADVLVSHARPCPAGPGAKGPAHVLVVTAATGQLGRLVVDGLLARGDPPGRHPGHGPRLDRLNATCADPAYGPSTWTMPTRRR